MSEVRPLKSSSRAERHAQIRAQFQYLLHLLAGGGIQRGPPVLEEAFRSRRPLRAPDGSPLPPQVGCLGARQQVIKGSTGGEGLSRRSALCSAGAARAERPF